MNSFNKLTVAQRLTLGFSVVIALLVIIAILGITRLAKINDNVRYLMEDKYQKVVLVQGIGKRSLDDARIVRNLILKTDPSARAKDKEVYDKNNDANSEAFKKLDQIIHSDAGRAELQSMVEARNAYRTYTDEVIRLALATQNSEATKVLFGENYQKQAQYFDTIKLLTAHEEEEMAAAEKLSAEDYASTRNWVIVLSVIAVLMSIAMAMLNIRSLTNQLGGEPAYVSEIAMQIASGNLSSKVFTKPGDTRSMLVSMKQMQEKLGEMVSDVKSSAEQLSKTAAEVATASTQVAQGSGHQSQAASSMAASVEEMTVSIDHVAENAGEASTASNYSGELSETGSQVILNAVAEMGQIEGSVLDSAKIIGGLAQQAEGITAIVNTIKDIAEQTNLLALNAAIEAARAGEQGRGFAVVADEVRKLAERTAKSTHEISGMIENIQNASREAVASMQSGGAKVSTGVTLANQAGESIQQIKTEVNRVVQLVSNISNSLKEQSTASRDIAVNVEKIAQMSEENNVAVQHTSQAANHLEELAASLQITVSRFRV